jgi:hypothetical protein
MIILRIARSTFNRDGPGHAQPASGLILSLSKGGGGIEAPDFISGALRRWPAPNARPPNSSPSRQAPLHHPHGAMGCASEIRSPIPAAIPPCGAPETRLCKPQKTPVHGVVPNQGAAGRLARYPLSWARLHRRDLILRDAAVPLLSMRARALKPHAEEGRRAEQPPYGGVCEPREEARLEV